MNVIKRCRQGVTVYEVWGFEDGVGWIEKKIIAGRPKLIKLSLTSRHSMAVPTVSPDSEYKSIQQIKRNISEFMIDKIFFSDTHFGGAKQQYNLHRMFFSRKKAETYLKLVQSGCNVSQMFNNY